MDLRCGEEEIAGDEITDDQNARSDKTGMNTVAHPCPLSLTRYLLLPWLPALLPPLPESLLSDRCRPE